MQWIFFFFGVITHKCVLVSVCHFLSLSFSIKCSDTSTTGKTLSIACVLSVALGALDLVLPKHCQEISIFLVTRPSLERDFPLNLDCFTVDTDNVLRSSLVSYIHLSSTKFSSVLWANLVLFACFLLLDFRLTFVTKKKGCGKIIIIIPHCFFYQKIPWSYFATSNIFLLQENTTGDPVNKWN